MQRSIDGSGNNPSSPATNAAGATLSRTTPAGYADGISIPADGPNPRAISNLVVGEGDATGGNAQGLSAFMYAWGQFIDHDLDRVPTDRTKPIGITVPADDAVFVPGSTIALSRSVTDPATGTGPGNPANPVNAVTGWLDASMIYGSDAATAASLRLADGHLLTSAGDNLPILRGMLTAGDVRATENPSLTALQTLFLREHNHWVDRLAAADPGLTGDQLYEQARAIVGAEVAHITYDEYLPRLLGSAAIPAYAGYNQAADPRITVEFAGAAYRWGHSIVSADTERLDEQGNVSGPELTLADTFFLTPEGFAAHGGADGFLRHLGSDLSQKMDARIVSDLRNLLFDPPDGQDLAAINIQRGRDLGLASLNETRKALGLAAYTGFNQITDDPGTLAGMRAAYTSIDQVDLWTGGLAERLAPGAFVGETFQRIIASQFTALRDGDRFWYQNAGLDPTLLAEVQATSLSDIILRDSDTRYVQDDVFLAYDRHAPGAAPENPDLPQLVVGGAGNETLRGGSTDDVLAGGGGRDVAVFHGTHAATALARLADGGWRATGPDGADILRDVEVARFDDMDVMLRGTRHDFTGTGTSDILFREAAGSLAQWQMTGTAYAAGGVIGNPGLDWHVAGTGDFNGDGKADILWRHDGGAVSVWAMNGLGAAAGGGTLGTVDLAWSIAGTGDFDGDGRTDILWRHAGGGLSVWAMDGTAQVGGGYLGTVDPAWRIATTGDFDGDGRSDILWRHANGTASIWEMDGTAMTGGDVIGTVGPDWTILGAGDFNGDGHADILWRNDNGTLAQWWMNGAANSGGGVFGALGADWQLGDIADFNGDGRADILWRHANGTVAIWEMNGLDTLASLAIGNPGTAWTIA